MKLRDGDCVEVAKTLTAGTLFIRKSAEPRSGQERLPVFESYGNRETSVQGTQFSDVVHSSSSRNLNACIKPLRVRRWTGLLHPNHVLSSAPAITLPSETAFARQVHPT